MYDSPPASGEGLGDGDGEGDETIEAGGIRTPAGEGLGDGTGGSGVGVGLAPPTQPHAMNSSAPTIDPWMVHRRQGISARRRVAGLKLATRSRQAAVTRDQENSASLVIVRPPYGVGVADRNVLPLD